MLQASGQGAIVEAGVTLYETRLKAALEPGENGKAVAIHVPTGDYAVGPTHRDAARLLSESHPRDGQVVTLTIGPPTEQEIAMANRYQTGGKT